jgi:hypothetical protein
LISSAQPGIILKELRTKSKQGKQMNYKLIINIWQQPIVVTFFDTYSRAIAAANGLLSSCIPVNLCLMGFVEGKGYIKEVYRSSNEESL